MSCTQEIANPVLNAPTPRAQCTDPRPSTSAIPENGSRKYWGTIEETIACDSTYVQKLGLCVKVPRYGSTAYVFMSSTYEFTTVEEHMLSGLFVIPEPFVALFDHPGLWSDACIPGEEHLSVSRVSDNKTMQNLPDRLAYALRNDFPMFTVHGILECVIRPFLQRSGFSFLKIFEDQDTFNEDDLRDAAMLFTALMK